MVLHIAAISDCTIAGLTIFAEIGSADIERGPGTESSTPRLALTLPICNMSGNAGPDTSHPARGCGRYDAATV